MSDATGADGFGSETVTLANGLTCAIPASSPLAKLLKSQRTWVGPGAKERLGILRRAKSIAVVGASPNSDALLVLRGIPAAVERLPSVLRQHRTRSRSRQPATPDHRSLP